MACDKKNGKTGMDKERDTMIGDGETLERVKNLLAQPKKDFIRR